MNNTWSYIVQYACACLLIITSIIMAFVQVFQIDTIAHGTLMYIAQAFLLAGSIFGLHLYVERFNKLIDDTQKRNSPRNPQ